MQKLWCVNQSVKTNRKDITNICYPNHVFQRNKIIEFVRSEISIFWEDVIRKQKEQRAKPYFLIYMCVTKIGISPYSPYLYATKNKIKYKLMNIKQ